MNQEEKTLTIETNIDASKSFISLNEEKKANIENENPEVISYFSTANKEPTIITTRERLICYSLLFTSSLIMNIDHGVFPACTTEIMADLNLDNTRLAFFGSLVYMGTAFSSIILSVILNIFNRKLLLLVSMIVSGLGIGSFALTKSLTILYFNRFLTGMFQATIFIYTPIWVDQFSPGNYDTLFMGLYQLSSTIGIILGYIIAQATKSSYYGVNF